MSVIRCPDCDKVISTEFPYHICVPLTETEKVDGIKIIKGDKGSGMGLFSAQYNKVMRSRR
jgi:hypothetical protein